MTTVRINDIIQLLIVNKSIFKIKDKFLLLTRITFYKKRKKEGGNNMENLSGIITMILATTMVMVALPTQIIKNYKEKRCGLSFLMVFLSLTVYISRFFYATLGKLWYIMLPDLFGIVFSSILFIQFFLYKKTKNWSIESKSFYLGHQIKDGLYFLKFAKNHYISQK